MRSLLPVAVYCISLLSLQQLLALPVADRLERNRLELLKKLHALREEEIFTPKTGTKLASPTDSSPSSDLQPSIKWLSGYLLRDTPPTVMNTAHLEALVWARGEEGVEPQRDGVKRSSSCPLRVAGGPHRPQLMRVGAPGNLPGSEPQPPALSADWPERTGRLLPINPRSPHSYG